MFDQCDDTDTLQIGQFTWNLKFKTLGLKRKPNVCIHKAFTSPTHSPNPPVYPPRPIIVSPTRPPASRLFRFHPRIHPPLVLYEKLYKTNLLRFGLGFLVEQVMQISLEAYERELKLCPYVIGERCIRRMVRDDPGLWEYIAPDANIRSSTLSWTPAATWPYTCE